MKVLESKDVEECLDGVFIKEFLLDEEVTEEFIGHIGKLGQLKYFPHFPRPFFKITRKGEYIMKGVKGNRTFQIFFVNFSSDMERSISDHIGRFENLNIR